jgi:hypothetical protein
MGEGDEPAEIRVAGEAEKGLVERRGFLDVFGKKIYKGAVHACCPRDGAFRI